jgi:SAM-dependent methyltransferase
VSLPFARWFGEISRAAFYTLFRLEVRVCCWCSDRLNRPEIQALPPALQRFRVSESISIENFLKVGRGCASHIVDQARRMGFEFADGGRVLDFGCGCGRTLRWLVDDHPGVDFHGVDIDEQAVKWCSSYLTGAHFEKGAQEPPLSYPHGYFNMVYCFSVFTHLNENLQDLWLGELRRLLGPGGILLITVHGETAATGLSEERRRELLSAGILHTTSRKLNGILPEWYNTTWHTRRYIVSRLKGMFEDVEYVVVADGLQDIVVARRGR